MMLKWLVVLIVAFGSFGVFAQGPKITYKKKPGKIRFSTVDKTSPYGKVGIKTGDVVAEINGKAIDENGSLSDVDSVIQKGGSLKILRNGKPKVIKLKANPKAFVDEITLDEDVSSPETPPEEPPGPSQADDFAPEANP